MIFNNCHLKVRAQKGVQLLFILLPIFFLPQIGFSQYQVYYWANFENGSLPQDHIPLGVAFQNVIGIADYSKLTGMPAEFHSGKAASETGKYGLILRSDPKIWMTGLGVGVILNRDQLGARGRALYQADFFVPGGSVPLPSLAVLAMEPPFPGEKIPKSIYRFGMTKAFRMYFSYVIRGTEEATMYKEDRVFSEKMPRPAWHRFAIVFEGPNTIRCYVDGNELSFSPIQEPTLRKLQVGLMLADKEYSYTCYADNLCIQYTPQDVPLPDSPYLASWEKKPSQPQTTIIQPPTIETAFVWLDPDTAWQQSSVTQSSMLVYFHAPKIADTLRLNQIFETDKKAQDFLRKYILVKVDVNQLQGGMIAQKYRVFKVPTIIIFNPNGTEKLRAIFGKNDTWGTLSAKLSGK